MGGVPTPPGDAWVPPRCLGPTATPRPPPHPTVFVTLTCAFRYGREDLDVLGLSFRKDLFAATRQAVPPLPEEHRPPTRLQQRLLRKLGPTAHPFAFTVSPAPQLPVGCLVPSQFGVASPMLTWASLPHSYPQPSGAEPPHSISPPCYPLAPLTPQIPQNLPCSVTLQPGPEDTGKVGLGGGCWGGEGAIGEGAEGGGSGLGGL